MAQAAYPTRGAFSGRLPDRGGPSLSQPPFGQSAPGLGRQPQYSQQPAQQSTYGTYAQHAPGPQLAGGRGQMQGLAGAPLMGGGIEKENNVVNEIGEDSRDEINEAFALFDLDKDRHLDWHEFKIALRALGFDIEKSEASQLMAVNGVRRPNSVSVNAGVRGQQTQAHPSQMLMPQAAFVRIAAQKIYERDPADEIERAFNLFDADRKGYIDINDLRRVTQELGETSLEDQELLTMVEEFDYEDRGGITKDAFFSICLQ